MELKLRNHTLYGSYDLYCHNIILTGPSGYINFEQAFEHYGTKGGGGGG